MPIGTIATIASIAAAAASLSEMGYAAAQGAPKLPDTAQATRETAQAQAAALPTQRGISAAEAQGGTYNVPTARQKGNVQFVRLPNGNQTRYNAADWQQGGKFYGKFAGFDPTKNLITKRATIPAGTTPYNFQGFGTADIEGTLAKQMAAINEQLGAKYGTQYAQEAAKEAALADPEGTKARAMENQLIQNQIENPPPVNPLSPALESDINAQVKAGAGLDPQSLALLDNAVAQANSARGGTTQAGDVATSMSTGASGQQRLQQALAKGQAFLSSGSTPEDIQYRREQQNLENLGAYVGGVTPESQFSNLSGVSQGAAPMYQAATQPGQPTNAAAVGGPFSVSAYQQGLRNQLGQANGWLAGIGTALSGVNSGLNIAGSGGG